MKNGFLKNLYLVSLVKQAVGSIAPAAACHAETFMAGLNNVYIDSVIDGREVKFVVFHFIGQRFMIHWNGDRWLLYQQEAGAGRKFTDLQATIAGKNTGLGDCVCILREISKAFFRRSNQTLLKCRMNFLTDQRRFDGKVREQQSSQAIRMEGFQCAKITFFRDSLPVRAEPLCLP